MDPGPNAMDEQSSLLGEGHDGNNAAAQPPTAVEEDLRESKSSLYLFLLTLGVGGLQVAWATEMSNGSPFLISLGMSKAVLALVWIAGPLSGILVQPYIGSLSDRCRLRWGRRKPFMVSGTIATVVSLLALSWCREIVGFSARSMGLETTSDGSRSSLIVFAVLWVYILDFSINTVQASLRAFIVDCAPSHQQGDANAWASRLTGFGNILGHLFAYVDLPKAFPFFGNAQFKVLCAIASLSLSASVAVSAFCIPERDPRLDGPAKNSTLGMVSFFRSTLKSIGRLPPQTRKVCEVQFFNWIGWFPFLFYVSTYIGQLWVNPMLKENPNLTPGELNSLWEKATRAGSFGLFIFALTSFATNTFLPFFITPTHPRSQPRRNYHVAWYQRVFQHIQVPWLTLRRAWLLSHVLFALCMVSTFFVTSAAGGSALAGVVGISWALTLWAPFALISTDISRQALLNRSKRGGFHNTENRLDTSHYVLPDDEPNIEDRAGIVLGLHNVAVSAPQVLSTMISSIIFKATQRNRSVAGDDSVSWVLRFGGIAALIAAFMTARIDDDWDTGFNQARPENV